MPSDRAGDDGGAAFPCEVPVIRARGTTIERGMSLRDYFAAAALTGLLSSGPFGCGPDGIVAEAYQYADAMIAARKSGAGHDEARALARDERGER